MQTSLPKRTVALLGIGHTNAHIVKMWRMQPIADTQLVCISNHAISTYSGMLPGVLAGQYPTGRMEIDLVRLCASVGARLVLDTVTGIDREQRLIQFKSRPPVSYDVLSIGIGSKPNMSSVDAKPGGVLAIKPMQTFLSRLRKRLKKLQSVANERPLRIGIVGGGAGGVEIAFCLPKRIERELSDAGVKFPAAEVHLFQSRDRLVPGMYDSTADIVEQELVRQGVAIHFGKYVTKVRNKGVTLTPRRDDGQPASDRGVVKGAVARAEPRPPGKLKAESEFVPLDLVLWATSATAPPLLGKLGLPTDQRGFLRTKDTLESIADHRIFVVGDSGTIENIDRPKAGIFAVRQGPILFENIKNTLRAAPNEIFKPQSDYLKLLNTGDDKAIGEYLGRTFFSKLALRWKDYIDVKFMKMYQNYSPPMMADSTPANSAESDAMRCLGCGGKVSQSVLSRVFQRLEIRKRPEVLIGLDSADDAAVLKMNGQIAVTTDFFAAPLDDPYLVGRMAALNSLSDVWAMNAEPVAALTMATLPFADPRHESAQESLLHELLSGAIHEFDKANVSLVGGHTIEGPRTTIGFTILANQSTKAPWTKAGMKKGDQLVLTKPIGSGVLLAAHMQAECRAAWYVELMKHLVVSNAAASAIAAKQKLAAVTDVTGFGLASHLYEMLAASEVSAELDLGKVSVLPGAVELVGNGIESTLAPSNRVVEQHMDAPAQMTDDLKSRYELLFDPQTCGGLLLSVAPAKSSELLAELGRVGLAPVVIGAVKKMKHDAPRIRVR